MTFLNWKPRIDYEYRKLQAARNIQIKEVWCENWKKCDEESIPNPIKIVWHVKSMSDTSQPVIFKECKPIPRMLNWVLSPRNYLPENEKMLLNIPFLSVKGSGEKFFKDLLNSYGGVRGCNDGKYKILDDEMLVELARNLHTKYTTTHERTPEPNTIIFEAISAYFYRRITSDELKKRYMQIYSNQHEIKNAHAQTPNTCEHTLKVFKKYFCRRCYVYNCELHREKSIEPPKQYQIKSNFCFKSPVESCGTSCFKLLEQKSSQTTQSSRECTKISPSTSQLALGFTVIKTEVDDDNDDDEKVQSKQEHWSEDEKTIFHALQKIFPNKYCIIAQSMLTRSCQEVYKYSKNTNSPVIVQEYSQNLMSTPQHRSKHKGWALYRRKRSDKMDNISTKLHNFTPCYHPGKLCDEFCSCVSLRNACEKFCSCKSNCTNRFLGCRCRTSCNSRKCPCFASLRECDADLCKTCGASKYKSQNINCTNISIQQKLSKHLLLARSDIAGWGIFLKDGARKDDFISEYIGEIISQEEADRRGKIYDMGKCSFLFDLNDDSVLDATREGSKIRFANHSKVPNCYAKVMMVLGNHRIGIFAKRDILPGEELFFDYRYRLTDQLKFVSIEREVEET